MTEDLMDLATILDELEADMAAMPPEEARSALLRRVTSLPTGAMAALALDAVLELTKRPKTSGEWLIWSNQHRMWWRPRHHGYTPQIEEAGRYTEQEARAVVAKATCDWQLSEEWRDPITGCNYISYDEVMVPCPKDLGCPVESISHECEVVND